MTAHVTVFVGAGFGGVLRYLVNRAALTYGASFPWWSTLAVNATGCFAMGLLAGYFALRGDSTQTVRLFLTTGVLGGYTTFSAFSLDAALMVQRNEWASATLYVIASVAFSLIGVFAGLATARM
jgi:fluoride exporter